MSAPTIPELFVPFVDDPASCAVLTDFDGTLSGVVAEPDDARPLPGVPELLDRLAERYATVGVVSGRPLAFLERHFGPGIELVGLYGIEARRGGVRREHPDAAHWRSVVDEVVELAHRSFPAGVGVEPKGYAMTLHYRQAPEHRAHIEQWAEEQAAHTGLVVAASRQSVELNLPIDVDKGHAVTDLAGDRAHVCFLGDDRADLEAFHALAALRRAGRHTVAVAVESDETPHELIEAADLTLGGPEDVRHLLEALAG